MYIQCSDRFAGEFVLTDSMNLDVNGENLGVGSLRVALDSMQCSHETHEHLSCLGETCEIYCSSQYTPIVGRL